MASNKPRFFTSDKLFGLTAMLISLVTLIIFVRQTNIMDKQSRLSAMPYLMIEKSTNGEAQKIQFTLVNHGVGPAIIESRRIIYKGNEYEKDFYQFLTENVPKLDTIEPFNWSSVYAGQAIPSNGRVVMVAYGGKAEEFELAENVISNLQDSLNFEIIYSSVYGDRWKISNESATPEEL